MRSAEGNPVVAIETRDCAHAALTRPIQFGVYEVCESETVAKYWFANLDRYCMLTPPVCAISSIVADS